MFPPDLAFNFVIKNEKEKLGVYHVKSQRAFPIFLCHILWVFNNLGLTDTVLFWKSYTKRMRVEMEHTDNFKYQHGSPFPT